MPRNKPPKPPVDNPPQPRKCGVCGKPIGEHTVHELAQCQSRKN